MKNIITLLILLGSFFVSSAQTDNPNAPVFKFEKVTHDFGTVKEGPTFSYDFIFTNVGKTPLIIQQCSASCGCTTPEWTKEPVAPGAKGKITVKYNTQGKPGPINKTVYIASNASVNNERFELYIRGNVTPAPTSTTTK